MKKDEFIFEISEGLMNDEGMVVFQPKVVGRLVRCAGCLYWMKNRDVPFCGFYRAETPEDGFSVEVCRNDLRKLRVSEVVASGW